MRAAVFFLSAAFALAFSNSAAAQTPLVDHHTHLWSERASAVMVRPLFPEVALPAPFAALLAARTESTDAAVLSELYLPDAMFLNFTGPVWIRGRAEIGAFLSGVQPGYRMRANAFRISADAGYITGTVTRGEGAAIDHRRSFLISVVRDGDVWRIGAESWSGGPPPLPHALSAEALIAELDEAHISRAAVFSAAHLYASALGDPRADEREAIRAENQWLSEQIRRYPDRLIGLCSFNPLRPYAAEELRYCVREQGMRGLKLHFADSGVDLTNADHRRRLRSVFRAANALRVPIVAHVAGRDGYGAEDARWMVELAAAAPNIPIQIAHLAGTGPGLDAVEALDAYVPRLANAPNLYFDVSSVVVRASGAEDLERVAQRLRAIGLERIVFGSDRSGDKNEAPGVAWSSFRRLPLSPAEFEVVARNSLY
jgi:predicted TIM-barrel fold metal-dependent hydrolase